MTTNVAFVRCYFPWRGTTLEVSRKSERSKQSSRSLHSEALLFGGKVVLCLWIRKTSSVSFAWKTTADTNGKNQIISMLGSRQVQPCPREIVTE